MSGQFKICLFAVRPIRSCSRALCVDGTF